MRKYNYYISIAKLLMSKSPEENVYQKTWKMIDEMKDIEQFDTDQAWGKMKNRFETEELISPTKDGALRTIHRRVRIVAAAIIIGVFAGFLWNGFDKDEFQLANYTNEVVIHKLADGTEVFLKPQSKIVISDNFNESSRNVHLEGEAFFKVERNELIPFKVYVEEALVTVLGTSFNIRVVDKTKAVEVLVKTGKVVLSSNGTITETIALTPDEMGVYSTGKVQKINPTVDNYMAWMDKKLVFKNAKLSQVVRDLNRAYSLNISFSDSALNSLAITSTYYDMNANELIESVCRTLHLTYKQNKNDYILVRQ